MSFKHRLINILIRNDKILTLIDFQPVSRLLICLQNCQMSRPLNLNIVLIHVREQHNGFCVSKNGKLNQLTFVQFYWQMEDV